MEYEGKAGTTGKQLDDMPDISKSVKIQQLYRSRNPNEMTNQLSGYAHEDIKEMVAEAWSECCNNPTPRSLAKEIGDFIRSEYKKKYGEI